MDKHGAQAARFPLPKSGIRAPLLSLSHSSRSGQLLAQGSKAADPLLIAPGEPDRSVLLRRISRRGPDQIPPLATSRVDEEAVRMLREWIAAMKREGEQPPRRAGGLSPRVWFRRRRLPSAGPGLGQRRTRRHADAGFALFLRRVSGLSAAHAPFEFVLH